MLTLYSDASRHFFYILIVETEPQTANWFLSELLKISMSNYEHHNMINKFPVSVYQIMNTTNNTCNKWQNTTSANAPKCNQPSFKGTQQRLIQTLHKSDALNTRIKNIPHF